MKAGEVSKAGGEGDGEEIFALADRRRGREQMGRCKSCVEAATATATATEESALSRSTTLDVIQKGASERARKCFSHAEDSEHPLYGVIAHKKALSLSIG